MSMTEDRSSALAARILEKRLADPEEAKKALKELKDTLNSTITQESEEDIAYAREKMRGLMDKIEEGIEGCAQLAVDSEHPRTYEVLGNLISQAAQMLERLVLIQERRKKIHGPDIQDHSGQNRSDIFFIGTNESLNELFEKAKLPVIDI